jgi:mRNA interferase RelE/StbE
LRFLTSADAVLAGRITEKLEALRKNPILHETKKLVGRPLYRIRVGDYRILYEIYWHDSAVLVTKIDHRSHVYD